MIFKRAWINKEGKHLLKIYSEETKKDDWVETTKDVYNYAKKVFKDGENIEIQYTSKDGTKLIDRITKTDSKNDQTSTQNNNNKSNSNLGKSKFDSELSKRQTCMNATGSIMQSLVGQVEPNNVTGLMETIYNKALELING